MQDMYQKDEFKDSSTDPVISLRQHTSNLVEERDVLDDLQEKVHTNDKHDITENKQHRNGWHEFPESETKSNVYKVSFLSFKKHFKIIIIIIIIIMIVMFP